MGLFFPHFGHPLGPVAPTSLKLKQSLPSAEEGTAKPSLKLSIGGTTGCKLRHVIGAYRVVIGGITKVLHQHQGRSQARDSWASTPREMLPIVREEIFFFSYYWQSELCRNIVYHSSRGKIALINFTHSVKHAGTR